ncbi:hypothetical protein CRG98_036908 [Punica granatum]|uniref:PRP1 splicing factor N-terminal domain-containing protein n=1 Tax=Punica granatum TaxID=22663 RepID=A0A2I0IH19_PUNGR|nr:hypothetical protein CRG98_036908 [Punica granatum]
MYAASVGIRATFALGSATPPRRMTNQHRVAEEDELYRRIEQIIDIRLVRRLDLVLDRLTERMGALMEARQEVDPRHGRIPNPTADLEDVECDSYSPEFDEEEEDDEGDDKGYDENRKFDEFEGNDMGLFASAEYYEDDKEADTVWETIDKRMDSRRKDRREARVKQEIEKYRASNQQMRTGMSDVSIEPITAAEYFESGFFLIIRSRAWTDIGFRSSIEDVYVCVDNFISGLLSYNVSRAHPATWNFGRTDQSYFHYQDQTLLNLKEPVVAPSSSPDVAAIILVVTLPEQDRVNYLQNSLRKGCLGKEMKVQPITEHVIGGPLPCEHLHELTPQPPLRTLHR